MTRNGNRSVRLILARVCGIAALAAVAVAVPASAAQAAVTLSKVALSATEVVLNGDAGCGNRTKVSVTVYDPSTDADEVWNVTADVVASNGDIADFLVLNYASRSGNYVTYTDWVFLCGFDGPGRYRVNTEVDWWDDTLSTVRVIENTTSFYLKRPTSLTYNASPEPVKRGTALTHTGRLMFDPYSYGAMYGARGITLKIYFRKYNTSSYVYKGSVVTGSGGYYNRKLTAWDSGVWKVVYAGAAGRQARTMYDAVSVRS